MAARVWMFDLLSCLKVECEWKCGWERADRFGCVRWYIGQKRLLAASYLSVCPHILACLSLNGLLWNFILGTLWKSVEKTQIPLTSNKISALYMKTSVRLIVAGNIKWPPTVLRKWSVITQLDSAGGTNITRTRPSVTLYVNCLSCLFCVFK